MMDRLLVITGATGGLGVPLVRRALSEGRRVLAIGRNRAVLAQLQALGAEVLRGDLRKAPTLEALAQRLGREEVDVIHAAAQSVAYADPAIIMDHNVGVTRALVEMVGPRGAGRFVFISSPSVLLRPRDQWDLDENTPIPGQGYTAYAASKAAAEGVVRALGPRAVIVRPRALYGPTDTALLPRLITAASQGALPLLRGGRACTQLTWMEDAVEGVWRALECQAAGGQVFHLAGEERWTVRAVVEKACAQVGVPARFVPVPLGVARVAARLGEWHAAGWRGHKEPRLTRHAVAALAWSQTYDTGRARQVLGWAPSRGLEETLDAATAHLRAAPAHIQGA